MTLPEMQTTFAAGWRTMYAGIQQLFSGPACLMSKDFFRSDLSNDDTLLEVGAPGCTASVSELFLG